jgi:hypothetical protein
VPGFSTRNSAKASRVPTTVLGGRAARMFSGAPPNKIVTLGALTVLLHSRGGLTVNRAWSKVGMAQPGTAAAAWWRAPSGIVLAFGAAMPRFRRPTCAWVASWLVSFAAACSDAYPPEADHKQAVGGPQPSAAESKAPASELAQPPLQVLAQGEHSPWSLAIDERYVYWTTPTELRRVPLAGGAVKTLATGLGLRRVTAAEGGVFITDGIGGKVYRVDRESGSAEVIGTGVYPDGIAVHGRNVYWANASQTLGEGTVAVARLGDKTTSILAEGLVGPSGVAADDDFVYFTSSSQGCGSGTPGASGASGAGGCYGGGVSKRALSGGAVQLIDMQGTPLDVVVGKRGVYWILMPARVMFAAFPANTGRVLADVTGEVAGPIAVDAESFYFSSSDYGRVLKVPLDGGQAQRLVTDLGTVGAIAADASWVYVAASSQGRILRVAKDGSASKPSGPITGPCVTPLGTAAEIAATPRADQNLEMLALRLDAGRMTASEESYARVVADVAAIRGAQPALAGIGHFGRNDGKQLLLGPDDVTMQSIAANHYSAWDCLNDFYKLESREPVVASYVLLKFKGNYDLNLLAGLYKSLPGMRSAVSNVSGGDGATICAWRDGTKIEYVVDRASGDCLAGCINHDAHAFLSTAAGVIEAQGVWNSETGESRPDWFTRVCR